MEVFFNGQPLKKDFESYIDSPYVLSLIAYTRDIYLGRGSYNEAYMMLETSLMFETFEIFDKVFDRFFNMGENHPYGSYKDIKYFCEYIRKESTLNNIFKRKVYHHIIRKFIRPQLEKDKISDNPSLLAKWLPREKGKFGWLVKEIAWCCYDEAYDLISHSLKQYRQDITSINRKLDTAQIHMSNGTWSDIKEFRGITLLLQERSFMSNKNEDRAICAKHLSERPPIFNKSLMTPQYLVQQSLLQKDPLYNNYWTNLCKSYPQCKKYIPAVDCMEGIGLALITAEACGLKNIITGTKSVNIDMDFNDKVREIKHAIAPVKPDYLDDNFIVFSNKECDISKYGHLNIVYWNVTGEKSLPRKEENVTLISGNDSLMLKCLLGGELTFEAMLKDSRYKF